MSTRDKFGLRDFDAYAIEKLDLDDQTFANAFRSRFPDWADGLETWTDRVPQIREGQLGIEFPRRSTPGPRTPRLFISHRKDDEDRALEIADLAIGQGYAIWLDVLDPRLPAVHASQQPEPIRSLLIAWIVEMALINSTHLIAVLSKNTPGSMWVPYEYGRVKQGPVTLECAASIESSWPKKKNLPEYLYLGPRAENDQDIKDWLRETKP